MIRLEQEEGALVRVVGGAVIPEHDSDHLEAEEGAGAPSAASRDACIGSQDRGHDPEQPRAIRQAKDRSDRLYNLPAAQRLKRGRHHLDALLHRQVT